jgi:uncharacterized protein YqfB (UPF0267 family)
MVMTKDEIIAVMTDTINKMNREQAWQNGVPSDQVEQVISQMQPELNRVNGIVYDKLAELGLWTTV